MYAVLHVSVYAKNIFSYVNTNLHKVGQSNPITGLDRPWGFQEVEAPRYQDNRHMKVVR